MIPGDLPEATCESSRQKVVNLSLFIEITQHRASDPGLGQRHQLYPMAKRFMYLTMIMDWHSRRVPAWQTSNTLEPNAYVKTLQEAFLRYGATDTSKTDQSAQYTNEIFAAIPKAYGVKITMDGKDRWSDNVFIEGLWRNVKYKNGYLQANDSRAIRHAKLTPPVSVS